MLHTGSDIDGNVNRSCRRSWHNHTRLVQRAISVCTHNPLLHLSHLQPFIRPTRQESIHLSLSLHTHTPSVTHIHASPLYLYLCAPVSFQSLPFLSISILSVFLCFPLSSSFFFSSHSSVVWAFKGSHLFFFFSSPSSSIWQLAADQEGSRFLIPETCPSMDTPLPLARDLQFWIPGAARPPHPQITFQLPRREVTPHRQTQGVFDTHVLCMSLCIHMYSQQEVSHLLSKFWVSTEAGCMYACQSWCKMATEVQNGS